MTKTVHDLLESIVDRKPAETKEIFEEVIKEKLRNRVSDHIEVVSEDFFGSVEDSEEDVEVEEKTDADEDEKESD